jgi:hypothetical protein
VPSASDGAIGGVGALVTVNNLLILVLVDDAVTLPE